MPALPYLSGEQLAALASYPDVVEVLRRAVTDGEIDPEADAERVFAPAPGGEFLLMPSSGTTWSGVKLVTVAPGNPEHGRPKIQGVYTLFASADLAPVAVLDAVELTLLRTPGTTVLAIAHLLAAGPGRTAEPTSVAVFGTGPQAERHLRCLQSVIGSIDVRVIGRRAAAAEAFVDRVGDGEGRRLRVGSPEDVRRAAVVLCVTSSSTPVFDAELVADDAVVAAVGSHGPGRAELPADLIRRSDIVVEARASAMREAGNLLQARTPHEWADHPIANLADLAAGHVRRTPGRPAVFSGVGMAWEDLAVATALYERHRTHLL